MAWYCNIAESFASFRSEKVTCLDNSNVSYYHLSKSKGLIMSKKNTSLVPISKKLPAVRDAGGVKNVFSLYEGERHFKDREDVRQHLPDILGKALARTWIDADFHKAFDQDPVSTLEAHGVFIPSTMSIEFQRKTADRPRIVVYEKNPNSKFKARVLYLQLVMMAGR